MNTNETIAAAMAAARYERIDQGETVYGEITSMPGVYAVGSTREECEVELRSVLTEWLVLKSTLEIESILHYGGVIGDPMGDATTDDA